MLGQGEIALHSDTCDHHVAGEFPAAATAHPEGAVDRTLDGIDNDTEMQLHAGSRCSASTN